MMEPRRSNRPIAVLSLLLVLTAGGAASAAAAPLSLLGDRFHVDATWRTADGHSGIGTPVSLTSETGYFWFFSPTNVEVLVKALDACSSAAPRFWIFGAGLTDAEVTLTVTDQSTGQQKTYHNAQGQPFLPIQDTDAFASCGEPSHCGQGSSAELAVTPRPGPDTGLEALALLMGKGLTADDAVYGRVLRDVAAMRASHPALVGLTFVPRFDPRLLVVDLDRATHDALVAGNYHAWDCLNAWYGVTQVETFAGELDALVHFDKFLDLGRVEVDYRAVPGVQGTQWQNSGAPDNANSFCGRIDGTTYHYYARVDGTLYYFTTQPGGAPVLVGTDPGDNSAPWAPTANFCFIGTVDYVPS
jgi:hypothetical protein